MVKADARKDYYADLGLPPNAELEDIKKQFRKLALKYHPDRNPGKEVEFIARFQAIQAAHEILSDPQQRLKYDTERLRAGYGKYYSTPRANTSRKTPAGGYTPASGPKPSPSSARSQSYQNGPSTGAHRYTSYARAAPQQPWGKKHDEGQTRADAYRGFQGMKSSPNMSDQGGFTNSGQSPRPKSAYEYFKASPKHGENTGPTRSHTSARRKQGFAPGTACGDEPMAANTSAYSSVPREDRAQPFNYVFSNSAPSPTARRMNASNPSAPDLERVRSQYASTGGEKTFFSSSWLGPTPSMHPSPGSPKSPRTSRTNPPSPTYPEASRHRSASPNLRTNQDRTFASSTSSSDVDDDDDDSRNDGSPAPKPKAVPKSRARRPQRPSDMHGWNTGTGHDSDSAASPRNPFAGTFASTNFHPEFDPTQAAKSSSHGNLRKEFSPEAWHNVSQEGWSNFFTPKPSEADTPRATPGNNNRGRPSAQNGSPWTGQSAKPPSSQDSSRSGSTAQQQPTPFAGAKFSADDWVEQFKNLSWVTNNEGVQPQSNAQRTTSPKKQTRPAVSKARSAPQAASVSTETEEEAKNPPNGTANSDSATPSVEAADDGAEAMDLDDDTPAKQTAAPLPATDSKAPEPAAKPTQPRPKAKPSSSGGKEKQNSESNKHFDLKNLTNMAPFTSTNNGGIDDLRDISTTLPFESRPKAPKMDARNVRPRQLACPNPPKRPRRPGLIPTGLGAQMALLRLAWERYVGEVNTYMREWNEFDRRMLQHFNARHEANKTGLAPGWVSSIGDSARLNVNSYDDDDDADNDDESEITGGGGGGGDDDDESDNVMMAGSSRGGYSAYLRAIEEDMQVRKHWEVANELHLEFLLELGEIREWICNGGKLI